MSWYNYSIIETWLASSSVLPFLTSFCQYLTSVNTMHWILLHVCMLCLDLMGKKTPKNMLLDISAWWHKHILKCRYYSEHTGCPDLNLQNNLFTSVRQLWEHHEDNLSSSSSCTGRGDDHYTAIIIMQVWNIKEDQVNSNMISWSSKQIGSIITNQGNLVSAQDVL